MSYHFDNTVYCIEYFYAKPGYCEALIGALLKLIEPTRAEPGCVQYDLFQDNKNSNLIIMLVKFSNQQAMQHHENQPHVKYFIENEMSHYCEKILWNEGTGIL